MSFKLDFLKALRSVHQQGLASVSRAPLKQNENLRQGHRNAIKAIDELIAEERGGHEFTCVDCENDFTIPFGSYEGEFDHPPSEPVCPDCKEQRDLAERGFHGTKCKCSDCADDRGDWQYHQRVNG